MNCSGPAANRSRSCAPSVAALVVVLAMSVPTAAFAQSPRTENTLVLDDPDNRPAATIDDVAWLAGNWEGEAFGGTFEETWGTPSDGTMVGMYRLVHDGATTLYEIELIDEEEGSLVLKVKHFGPDLVAWEEKADFVSFPLVKISPDAVYFSGFTLRRLDDNNLQGYLVASNEDGVREVRLTYRRVGSEH